MLAGDLVYQQCDRQFPPIIQFRNVSCDGSNGGNWRGCESIIRLTRNRVTTIIYVIRQLINFIAGRKYLIIAVDDHKTSALCPGNEIFILVN